MVSCLKVVLRKDFCFPISLQQEQRIKTTPACSTVLLPQFQDKERLCCIFLGSVLEIKPQIDQILAKESAIFLENKTHEKNSFQDEFMRCCEKQKEQKNLVVKQKFKGKEWKHK